VARRRVLPGQVKPASTGTPAHSHPAAGDLILRPSRGKSLLFLTICLVFTPAGVLAIREGQPLMGSLILGFFGLGAAVFVIHLLPGASWLRLTRDGFHFRSLFRKPRFVSWRSVSRFSVSQVSDQDMVVFTSEEGASSPLAPLNAALTGHAEALPDTYGKKAEELAALMNEWRGRSPADISVSEARP